MKKCMLLGALVLVVCVALPAEAQKTEIFMGYSYNVNGAGKFTRENAQGWTANYTRYFTNSFGLTTDFGGTYGNVKDLTQLLAAPPLVGFQGADFGSYQFMFGPRIAIRRRWFTPFFQALIGVALTTQSSFAVTLPGQPTTGLPLCSPPTVVTNCSVPSKIDTDIAWGPGVGLDLTPIKYFGVRVAQVDYVPVRVTDAAGVSSWQRNVRARAGLVFRW